MIIVQFVLAFGVMVFLHELGHYLISRAFKIEIEEFGFGLPPRLCKLFTLGGTVFTLNWLPFGAFVRPKGEFENAGENSLRAAPAWKQILVCFGGPLMNLLTAFVIFTCMFDQVGWANTSVVLLDKVEAGSPAETAGMKSGDQFISIDGTVVDSFDKVTQTVQANLNKPISVVLKRGTEELELSVTPSSNPPEGQGAMGIVITYPMEDFTLGESIREGFSETTYMIGQYVTGLWQLISGQIEMGLESIVGPVGMFSYYEDVTEMDKETAEEVEQRIEEREESGQEITQPTASTVQTPWLNRLNFFAIIAIALGITNLFPIPALDGGRILILLPELITGKKLPEKVEMTFNSVGMILLLALMFFVMFKDIFMLTQG